MPQKEVLQKAMQSLDFIVVVDTMPMEITGWADVVLPECTYLERFDEIRTGPHRKPQIALRAPAAEPMFNTKPAYWMARELAKRLGVIDYFPFEKIEDQLDWQLKQIGSSLDEMMKLGVKTFDRQYEDLYFAPDEDVEFYTPTGKIELYSTTFEEAGFDEGGKSLRGDFRVAAAEDFRNRFESEWRAAKVRADNALQVQEIGHAVSSVL